jgi:hypothetical protein
MSSHFVKPLKNLNFKTKYTDWFEISRGYYPNSAPCNHTSCSLSESRETVSLKFFDLAWPLKRTWGRTTRWSITWPRRTRTQLRTRQQHRQPQPQWPHKHPSRQEQQQLPQQRPHRLREDNSLLNLLLSVIFLFYWYCSCILLNILC